jgi:hypothetical protein
MSIVKNLLIRNNKYEGVRLTIVGTQSGQITYNYTEANGNRYYFNSVGVAGGNPIMESATFQSFLTFTQSGAVTYEYNLIPMEPGETVFLDITGVAVNSSASKGYLRRAYGAYRHSGSALTAFGIGILYTTRSDFADVAMTLIPNGTQSITLRCVGQVSENVDWDIHINYTKGFNSLGQDPFTPPPSKPIYPAAPGPAPEP